MITVFALDLTDCVILLHRLFAAQHFYRVHKLRNRVQSVSEPETGLPDGGYTEQRRGMFGPEPVLGCERPQNWSLRRHHALEPAASFAATLTAQAEQAQRHLHAVGLCIGLVVLAYIVGVRLMAPAPVSSPSSCDRISTARDFCAPYEVVAHEVPLPEELECCRLCDRRDDCDFWEFDPHALTCTTVMFTQEPCMTTPSHETCTCYASTPKLSGLRPDHA